MWIPSAIIFLFRIFSLIQETRIPIPIQPQSTQINSQNERCFYIYKLWNIVTNHHLEALLPTVLIIPGKFSNPQNRKKNWNFDSLCKFKTIFESFVRKKPHSFITMIFFISHQTESDLKIHEKYYYICIKVFFLFFRIKTQTVFIFICINRKKVKEMKIEIFLQKIFSFLYAFFN